MSILERLLRWFYSVTRNMGPGIGPTSGNPSYGGSREMRRARGVHKSSTKKKKRKRGWYFK